MSTILEPAPSPGGPCTGPADYSLEKLLRTAEEHPNPDVFEDCQAFSRQVMEVNIIINATYGAAVKEARTQPDAERRMKIWRGMHAFCCRASEVLSGLKEQYPYCGTPETHDHVLNLSMAIGRKIHRLELEIKCQSHPIPQGLFPEN